MKEITAWRTGVRCSVLQCLAVCCRMLQCAVAVCCILLYRGYDTVAHSSKHLLDVDMTHPLVRHDSLCDMTRSRVCHDSFTCVP